MIPFVGPSYQLNTRKADVQRTVNLVPKRVESGTGKAGYVLESAPGLIERYAPVVDGSVRGFAAIPGGRAFVVIGNALYEYFDTTTDLIGIATLSTTTGPVSMAIGRDHLVIADGSDSPVYYAFSASAGFFITDSDYFPSDWVAYIAGRFVFGRKGTDQFFWSAIDDPTTFDALDFATAEAAPDGLVWGVAYREELVLFGTGTMEVWRPSSSADAAFEKNTGVSINVGCTAKYSVQRLDNMLMWIGQDENGGGVVYRMAGYSPQRASNYAIEEQLRASTDLSASTAWTYQMDGQAFYCLNADGLSTTWCFEVQGDWHERAEFVDGEFQPHRATNHVYFAGKHVVGDAEGYLYELSKDTYTNAGDTLCRERTSPHYATVSLNRMFFPRFRLDCSVGLIEDSTEPVVQLSYSNDGGHLWSDTLSRSLGAIGERTKRVQWNRLGSARDRVWRIRCTDNCPFDIINADVPAMEGSA